MDGESAREPHGIETPRQFSSKRSKALYQTTLLLVIVFILSGLATYFIYSRSQNRLINKGEDKLIQNEAYNTRTSTSFVMEYMLSLDVRKVQGSTPQVVIEAVKQGQLTKGQEYMNDQLSKMAEAEFFGLKDAMLIMPPSEFNPHAVVIAASDDSLINDWEVPSQLTEAIENGDPYFLMDEDLPELGLTGKSLILIKEVSIPSTGLKAAFVAARPMDEDIASLNQFFSAKGNHGKFVMMMTTGISIVIIILLTVIFLSYLIRRRIVRPMGELSAAAEQIKEGNLDVEIDVRKGEEFQGLKVAFRTMIENLHMIISLDHIEGDVQEMKRSTGYEHKERTGPRRSRIPYYITSFVLVMFIASGLVSFFTFNRIQKRIIDESIGRMIQNSSDGFASGSIYLNDILTPTIVEKMSEEGIKEPTPSELFNQIINGEISDYHRFYDRLTKGLVDNGVLGLEEILVIAVSDLIPEGATVAISSDESLVFRWKVPDYLIQAIKNDVTYLYMKDGVPELGLEGEHIIALHTAKAPLIIDSYLGIKSMHEEVSDMESFYASEKRNTYIPLILVILFTLIALILATFLALSFLIRRNITRPIDELSAAAEQVMEGNLDVEISVQKGEELEGLKTAFREMVESFRKLIARAVGEE